MPELYLPTIVFGDDAVDSCASILRGLTGYAVELEIPANTDYPTEQVYVLRVDDDYDVVVSKTNPMTEPIKATTAIPLNAIKTVTVL